MTIEQIKTQISNPDFEKLEFPIPDSIDGSKRKATFIKLKYYTGDNQPTEGLIKQTSFLQVSFEVKCYKPTIIQDPSYLNEDMVEVVPEPREVLLELKGRNFVDVFTADWKTIVTETGNVIATPYNGDIDYVGVSEWIEKGITNGEFTLESIPKLLSQIAFFKTLFTSNHGLIPVKAMIEKFANEAKWKDVELITY